MKKIFLLLAAVGMIFTACEPANGLDEDNNGNNGNNTEQPGGGNDDAIPTDKIVIKPSTITVEAAANNYIVAVSSPCSWRANTEEDWITLETELGIDGKQQLIFAVKDYWETEPREGKIVVSNSDEGFSAELTVVQKAFVPEWSVSPEVLNFAVEGGTQEIAITANFEYKYTANVDWITFKRTSSGISVTVPNYVEVDERNAEITISSEKYGISKIVSVKQEAFEPILEIEDVSTFECDYKRGTKTIAVTANFDYDVTCPSWITYTKVNDGVKLMFSTNYLTEPRTAEVKIFSEKYNLDGIVISVVQTGVPYKIGDILTQNGATGIVFYVGTGGVKIMSVEETRLAWSTEYVVTGATNWNDGANNMATIKKISGWKDKYPAFRWCADHGENWYLPAYSELQEIYHQRELLNVALEANGYTKLDLSDSPYYWSSTERNSSSSNVYSVDFNDGSSYSIYGKSNTFRVRAVQAF